MLNVYTFCDRNDVYDGNDALRLLLLQVGLQANL